MDIISESSLPITLTFGLIPFGNDTELIHAPTLGWIVLLLFFDKNAFDIE